MCREEIFTGTSVTGNIAITLFKTQAPLNCTVHTYTDRTKLLDNTEAHSGAMQGREKERKPWKARTQAACVEGRCHRSHGETAHRWLV